MLRHFSRCLLLAVLAAFSAVPAAADPITENVGEFYFQGDEFFEFFVLDNNASGLLAGLQFSAIIQIDGSDYADQFDPGPIGSGTSVFSPGLFPITAFTNGGRASLIFTIENSSLYPGQLELSNSLFYGDANEAPSLNARVFYTGEVPATIPEAPSMLVVLISLSALVIGRSFLI